MSLTPAMAAIEGQALQRSEIAGGLEFHHVESGRGVPLVLVHGVLGDWRSWAPQWPAFTPHFRTISYSRRYNAPNRNTQPSPDHSALVEAQDLAALLQVWDAEPAVLVGSSYGAYTALALAIARPECVRALVLLEPPMLRWADFSAEGRTAREVFERDVRVPARAAFECGDNERGVLLLTAGIAGSDAVARIAPEALRRRQENALAIRMLTLSSDEFPMLAPQDVRGVRVPTLLMAGARTPLIHDTVFRNLCAVMTQAEVHRIPDAGHSAARDNPTVFNRLTLDFLGRHGLPS